MNNKLKTQAVEQLFQAILSLKDLDEAYDFFEDVCTINEILSLSQRFEVAKMLREHRTYLDIIYELIKADMLVSDCVKVGDSE